MATRRAVSNPLALAVLRLLTERPMHPYEMNRTMRERRSEQSIKLNYGSLYSVVEQLERHGAITPQATVRDGRRPERTVYRITDAGRTLFDSWLAELLSEPVKEFPRFEAALSLISGLPPASAVKLLKERAERLRHDIATMRTDLRALGLTLPRLFWIEHEYEVVQQESELAFVERLIDDITSGSLEGLEHWHDGEEPTDSTI